MAPENYNSVGEDDPGYDFATVWRGTVRAALRYRQTRSLINQMEFLVDLTGRIGESTINSQKLNFSQREQIGIKLAQLPESTIYGISDKGVLTIAPSGLLKAVNGKELGRLRRCKKCEKVFWASRWDSKCCSPSCNNTFNVLQSTNKRKNDPKGHAWKRYVTETANERANDELRKIGYTEEDITAYRKQYRKFPHRVIYDYLVEKAIDNNRGPDRVPLPKKITGQLKQFLSKRT